MWLAGHAFSKGMRLKYSEGLIKDGVAIAGETEKGVFAALGLPYPLPSEREIVEGKPVWMLPKNRLFGIIIGELKDGEAAVQKNKNSCNLPTNKAHFTFLHSNNMQEITHKLYS